MRYPLETQLVQSAWWIKKKREMGENIILFLGARTGGLFRSKALYGTADHFSPRAFPRMTRCEQFDECYRVLFQENFSEGERENIFITSLQGLQPSGADNKLAQLIKLGFFDTIISTNRDDLLPRALQKAGMNEGQDFHRCTTQQDINENTKYLQSERPCILFTTASDPSDKDTTLSSQDDIQMQEQWKIYIASRLKCSTLMLGYDPRWDQAINALLPSEGDELWYVNEKAPPAELSQHLQNRRGRYILEGEDVYDRFIRSLYWYLTEYELPGTGSLPSLNSPFQSPQRKTISHSTPIIAEKQNKTLVSDSREQKNLLPLSQNDKKFEQKHRTCIFIGYHKNDKAYLKQFKMHLATYERQNLLNVWDDSKIAPGKNRQEEIQQALKTTRIAILLVSPDFLASDFIFKNILPPLLQAAEEGGAIILPVILQHCMFEDTVLHQFQTVNLPDEPLAEKTSNERHRIWTELVRFVTTLGREINHDSRNT